jgi:hypothetical protein
VPIQRELARPVSSRERGDRYTLQVHAAGIRTSPREQRSHDGGNTQWDKALYAEKSLEVRATKDEEARSAVNWGVTPG